MTRLSAGMASIVRTAMGYRERFAFKLPASADAAAQARHRIVQAAAERRDQPDGDTLGLLVSEVVTNAVLHGGDESGLDVEVVLSDEVVRVAVSDTGNGFVPRPRALDSDEIGGWGLYLVERLAVAWGVSSGERTTVWFELPCAPAT